MGESAEFKLAFFGLQPELQAEVRKYLRQNRLRQLELEKLFAVAQDAEVGLTEKGWKKRVQWTGSYNRKDRCQEVRGCRSQHCHAGRSKRSHRRSEEGEPTALRSAPTAMIVGSIAIEGQRTVCGRAVGLLGMDYSRNDQSSWGRSRGSASTGTGSRSMHDRSYDAGGGALCFICDKTGHGWFNCPQKKGGKGCFRCGSESH